MRRLVLSCVALLGVGVVWACGGDDSTTITLPDGGQGFDVGNGGDSNGDDGGGGQDTSPADTAPPCVNLQCQQVTCDGGGTTTLTGVVLDPAKANPVYNAIVYIPNAPTTAPVHGATCDRCNTAPSGSPLVITTTKADGSFSLDNVPVGADIPIVVQIGKWRRIGKVTVNACVPNMVDKEITRLPKKASEGDLPLIGIATGLCDPVECVLRKMGVDDSEFTPASGMGHVHMFQGQGSQSAGMGTTPSTDLWSKKLANYDVVMNGCECAPPDPQNTIPNTNMRDYAGQGGRVMASHYQNKWIQFGAQPFPQAANWGNGFGNNPTTIDQNYPKQKAFADWLSATGASTTKGQIALDQLRTDVLSVNAPTIAWMEIPKGNQSSGLVPQMTFQAPFALADGGGVVDSGASDGGSGGACGKVLYSDYHTEVPVNGNAAFPAECTNMTMNASEKALEFMIFDLMSCIQDDTAAPVVPPTQ